MSKRTRQRWAKLGHDNGYGYPFMPSWICGYTYRLVMRMAHRFHWHYAPPSFPNHDTQLWCQWCGLRYTLPKAASARREEEGQIMPSWGQQKDAAYHERNMLVAFVSRVHPSHRYKHPEADTAWDDDWRWIVCIHSPAGQLTWHIHDSEIDLFAHLACDDKELPGHWDGHTTTEKYERLRIMNT